MKRPPALFLAAFVLMSCNASTNNTGDAGGDGAVSDAVGDVSVMTCTPPSPPPGSPVIFAAPSPVGPGEVALLFGASVGTAAVVTGVRLDDSDPGLPPGLADCVPTTASALTILQASDLSVKAVIPAQWNAGLYALVVQNATGAGAPVVLNRPRVDWIHAGAGGAVVSGATVDVYGRSFGAKPLAWVVDSSAKATVLALSSPSDGYAASFTVPMLPTGAYNLFLHSGQGGRYGFSEPFTVTVVAPSPWPTTTYPVAANTGNDDAALAAAMVQAKSHGGGVVEMATGSYTLTAAVNIPPQTVLRSATGNRNDVKITFNQPTTPFPYGFAGSSDFSVESITVTSSTSARLFQCPSGADFFRDPSTGEPQYQPDPPCQNAKLHDVSFTLTTLRDLGGVPTGAPTSTIMVVINGDDCEISDSILTNNGGSALGLAKAKRFYLMRNTLVSGTTRVPANQPMPLAGGGVGGGGVGVYSARESAFVGNTIGPTPNLGAASTLFIEYDAHNLYVAENTIGPNLSDYGEGMSFDAPYYPLFVGIPSATTGRKVTISRVLNAAGNSVFGGPKNGMWPANSGTTPPWAGAEDLVGSSVVVVNGTGLGQYAELVSNDASTSGGSTTVTVDRDWRVPLDATSVVEIATIKSKVVFARNTFHNVGVGAQLYAGGYDFIIDQTMGEAVEGTYCNANDFMSQRASATDLQRRFSRCYFNQWINTMMTNSVDANYPWVAKGHGPGLFTPYVNGLVGVQVGIGADPLQPPQRGLGAVGNIIRGNKVDSFTFGFVLNHNGPPVSATGGRDNLIEHNQTSSVPVGTYVGPDFPHTLVRDATCTSGCDAGIVDLNDGG